MESVTGPIYAYRVYGSEIKKDHPLGTTRVLTPVHVRWLNENGDPCSGVDFDEQSSLIEIDLFDWHVSPMVPTMESGHHVWALAKPSPNNEFDDIEEWWPQAVTQEWVAGRQESYTGLRCGVHSFKRLRHAIDYSRVARSPFQHVANVAVIAKIELGGIVVEHDDGYRSEKSRIVSLMMTEGPEFRENMARHLGWPFEIGEPHE